MRTNSFGTVFPDASDFLEANELILASLTIGADFVVERDGATGNHIVTVHKKSAKASSELAASLCLESDKSSVTNDLVNRFKQTHPMHEVRLDASLSTGTAATGCPQGAYFSVTDKAGKVLMERINGWGPERPHMVRSMTKAISCSILLALQDRGILCLDEPVGKYLEEYNQIGSPLAKITVRQLVTHTSGMHSYLGLAGDGSPPALTDPTMPLRESARQIANIALVSEPGTEFHYTELGYQVAGAAAEVAAGKPWVEIFEEVLGGPLEMNNTRWFNSYSAEPNPPNCLVAIGAVTSASDLLKVVRMLLNGGMHTKADGTTVRILSEAGAKSILTPQNIGDVSKDNIFVMNSSMHKVTEPMVIDGLITAEELDAASATWNDVGYGLGVWMGKDPLTGVRHAFLLSAYNCCISILGFDTPEPLITCLFAFAMKNSTHAILAGLCWKEWHAMKRTDNVKQ